jgi:hypothetical protein
MTRFHERLRQARTAAGFRSAQAAADAFGWTYPTYAAHENGSRHAKSRAIETYAVAFGVRLQWLALGLGSMKREGSSEAAAALQPESPQLREDAVPFQPRPTQNLGSLIKGMGLSSGTCCGYIATQPIPIFLLDGGDLLIIDLSRRAATGDLVLYTHADPDTGMASTHVARFYDDRLITGSALAEVSTVDTERDVIMGVIVAVIRRLGIGMG